MRPNLSNWVLKKRFGRKAASHRSASYVRFGEPDDLPALALVGAALTIRPGLLVELALRRGSFAACHAVWVFDVFFLRQCGGQAAVAEVDHGDLEFIVTATYGQAIAFPQGPARLHPVAVDLHLAALDGVAGQPAGFEEARGPEPLCRPCGIRDS